MFSTAPDILSTASICSLPSRGGSSCSRAESSDDRTEVGIWKEPSQLVDPVFSYVQYIVCRRDDYRVLLLNAVLTFRESVINLGIFEKRRVYFCHRLDISSAVCCLRRRRGQSAQRVKSILRSFLQSPSAAFAFVVVGVDGWVLAGTSPAWIVDLVRVCCYCSCCCIF